GEVRRLLEEQRSSQRALPMRVRSARCRVSPERSPVSWHLALGTWHLEVRSPDRLGATARARLALDLDRLLLGDLDTVRRDRLDLQQLGAHPNPLADLDRPREADPVEAVVDPHLAAEVDLDALPVASERRQQ